MPASPRCPTTGVGRQVGDHGWRERAGAWAGAPGCMGQLAAWGSGEGRRLVLRLPSSVGAPALPSACPGRGQGQAGKRHGKAQLLQHPPLPATGCSVQPAAGRWAAVPPPQVHGRCARGGREGSGAWPQGAGRETRWSQSWQGVARASLGPRSPEQRDSPKSVPTAPSWPGRGAWWGSPIFLEAGKGPPGAGGGIAFCSVYVWDRKNGKPEASPGGLLAQQGPWAARLAPLAGCAAAAFWGKKAGEGMGPGLTAGGLQGAEATLPSALMLTKSILWRTALGNSMPAQPVLLLCSAPPAVAPSWHRWCAPSRQRSPSSVAHWVNGCCILIPLELQQGLPSTVTLWEPAAGPGLSHGAGGEGTGRAAGDGRAASPI